MPGALVTVSSQIFCSHASGQCTPSTQNTKVLAGGQPVLTISDQYLVAGCLFTLPNGKPQPCVRILWTQGATKVLVNGKPALLVSSTGTCWSGDQIPAGPPTVTAAQSKVTGT
jgi:hypothetical protein